MKHEVAKREAQLPSTQMADLYGDVTVSAQDFLIPKLLPMQGMSDLVMAGKAVIGEIRDSVSGDKKGQIDTPLAFIPIYVQKKWDILVEETPGKFEYDRSVPVIDNPLVPGYNANWEWSDREKQPDGSMQSVKRIYRYDFFVLLPDDIAKGVAIPYVLSFKSTSVKAGKKLFTEVYVRNRDAKVAPWAYKFLLSGAREKNDKGTYIVLDVAKGDAIDDATNAACLNWWKQLKASAPKIDESDVVKTTGEVAPEELGDLETVSKF